MIKKTSRNEARKARHARIRKKLMVLASYQDYVYLDL